MGKTIWKAIKNFFVSFFVALGITPSSIGATLGKLMKRGWKLLLGIVVLYYFMSAVKDITVPWWIWIVLVLILLGLLFLLDAAHGFKTVKSLKLGVSIKKVKGLKTALWIIGIYLVLCTQLFKGNIYPRFRNVWLPNADTRDEQRMVREAGQPTAEGTVVYICSVDKYYDYWFSFDENCSTRFIVSCTMERRYKNGTKDTVYADNTKPNPIYNDREHNAFYAKILDPNHPVEWEKMKYTVQEYKTVAVAH